MANKKSPDERRLYTIDFLLVVAVATSAIALILEWVIGCGQWWIFIALVIFAVFTVIMSNLDFQNQADLEQLSATTRAMMAAGVVDPDKELKSKIRWRKIRAGILFAMIAAITNVADYYLVNDLCDGPYAFEEIINR